MLCHPGDHESPPSCFAPQHGLFSCALRSPSVVAVAGQANYCQSCICSRKTFLYQDQAVTQAFGRIFGLGYLRGCRKTTRETHLASATPKLHTADGHTQTLWDFPPIELSSFSALVKETRTLSLVTVCSGRRS